MRKTTLYLPDALHETLRSTARRIGKSQADIVREALEAYLQAQPRPIPRSIGAGEDPNLSGEDSEAWLREHWDPR
jgi:plasmid stability protein